VSQHDSNIKGTLLPPALVQVPFYYRLMVCLSLCLSAGYLKNSGSVFVKFGE